MVPDTIKAILAPTLTERGIRQWWQARNRYLGGRRPCEAWDGERDVVEQAARAFEGGLYV